MTDHDTALTVDCVIDGRIFRRFAVFDSLERQRRWLSPVIFSVIMLGCAGICFAMLPQNTRAWLPGGALALVGAGVPAVYMLKFLSSVNTQIKLHGLSSPRLVYSLTLSREPDGVLIKTPAGESTRYAWSAVHGAYRVSDCVYLYVSPSKAFLLPEPRSGELWAFFTAQLPPEKLHSRR